MKRKSLAERALELALAERFDGDCPFDNRDVIVNCGEHGEGCQSDMAGCWKKYFLAQARKKK
jgi:hypothetical protein